MCGDGGNDCGALRAAHVGFALSQGDASIVAPFSSSKGSVMALVDLTKAGRACVMNCTSVFKFFTIAVLTHSFGSLVVCQLFFLYMSEYLFYIKDCLCLTMLGTIAIAQNKPEFRSPLKPKDQLPSCNLLGFTSLAELGTILVIFYGLIIGIFSTINNEDLWSSAKHWYRSHGSAVSTMVDRTDSYAKSSHPGGAILGYLLPSVYFRAKSLKS